MDYAEAGVDISLADQAKQRIRRLASRTFTKGVIGGIGSFGGLFALDKKWRESEDPSLLPNTEQGGR